jgi:hypothetical protein
MSLPVPTKRLPRPPVLSDEEELAQIKAAMEPDEWMEDDDLLDHPAFAGEAESDEDAAEGE